MVKFGVMSVFVACAMLIPATVSAERINQKIKSVDTESNKLTLKNGIEIYYGDDVVEADLVPGARITAYYKKSGRVYVASKLTVTSKKKD